MTSGRDGPGGELLDEEIIREKFPDEPEEETPVAFNPTGGDPSTQSTKLKLKRL